MLATVLLTTLARPATACPDRLAAIEATETAVLEGRLVAAEEAKQSALRAFACGGRAEPDLLARLWLADAVLLSIGGDDEAADEALAAAARVAPNTWNSAYGSVFRERFEAQMAFHHGEGRLVLEPILSSHGTPVGISLAIDGRSVPAGSIPVSSGLHLTQAGVGEDMSFAKEVFVLSGQEVVVRAHIDRKAPAEPMPAMPVMPALPVPKVKDGGIPGFLLAGLGSAAGAAAFAGGALSQNRPMRDARSQAALDRAFRRQVAYGATSYTLAGLALGCVGLEIAF